nr:hypothetical protein [uncultured Draconibacterium sp.]
MLEKNLKDIREININDLEPYGFVDNEKLKSTITGLSEIKPIVEELLDISERERLPIALIKHIRQFNEELIEFFYKIEEHMNGNAELVAKHKDNLLGLINGYFIQCFDISRSRSRSLLETYTIAKNFIKQDNKGEEAHKRLDNKIEDLKSTINLSEIKQTKIKAESLLTELQNKIADKTVSNYAVVFADQAERHKKLANIWITGGIIISVGYSGSFCATDFGMVCASDFGSNCATG